MPYVVPQAQLVVEVFVRDIAASLAFYQRLGFDLVEDKGGFAGLAWEGCLLFLDQRPDQPRPGRPAANVRVMVPNVDALWRLVTEMNAPIYSAIADRDYGIRDFTVLDPDGFGVRFGSWLPGMHPSERGIDAD